MDPKIRKQLKSQSGREDKCPTLTTRELELAEQFWLHSTQELAFLNEISSLRVKGNCDQ